MVHRYCTKLDIRYSHLGYSPSGTKLEIKIFNSYLKLPDGEYLRSLLVGGFNLKNISQLGRLFPIYGKIKHIPNHQPERVNILDHLRSLILVPKISAIRAPQTSGRRLSLVIYQTDLRRRSEILLGIYQG